MSPTVFISQQEVPDLLPMADCIEAMRDALAALARGDAIQPLRPVMWLPERVGALGMMPGHLGPIDTMGIKTVTVFPGNAGTEFDSHQGTVMLFDSSNGRLKAVVDATEITAVRTAAVSAVATDVLARPDARVMAVLGAGVQGNSHLAAIPLVRPIEEVRVWSRDPENAKRLASANVNGSMVRPAASVAEAVAGADIVCTTTASPDPVLTGDLMEAGMHVNAIGSSVPFAREIDAAGMARSRIFADRRESVLNESGDFILARSEGAVVDDDIVAEIGEVLIGAHAGREDEKEITLFDSLGLAIEDIAAANLVYRNAVHRDAGTVIEFGGARHD